MLINKRRNRPAAHIHLVSNTKGTPSDPLNLLSAELRNNGAPLADSSRTDSQRPRDIRGALKVIHNVLLEHGPSLTVVHDLTQPQSKTKVLTSVDMDKLSTLAGRLEDAMRDKKVTLSELARACQVSPAAVSKWLDGKTKKLTAENYVKAGRALGVREEWLRTGKLPRDREHGQEERQFDQVIELLQQLRGPLASLSSAIEQLVPAAASGAKKRQN